MATRTNKSGCSQPGKLNARQLRAMDMMLSGTPLQEVAERVGVTRQTVSEWKNHHPEFKATFQRLMSEAEEDLSHSMALNAGFMVSNLRKLAAEGNGESRLKAIQFYFEKFVRDDAGAIPGLSDTDALLLRVMGGRNGLHTAVTQGRASMQGDDA